MAIHTKAAGRGGHLGVEICDDTQTETRELDLGLRMANKGTPTTHTDLPSPPRFRHFGDAPSTPQEAVKIVRPRAKSLSLPITKGVLD